MPPTTLWFLRNERDARKVLASYRKEKQERWPCGRERNRAYVYHFLLLDIQLKESNINKVRHLLTIGFSHTKDDEIKEEEEHDLMLQPDNFMKLWFVREFLMRDLWVTAIFLSSTGHFY